MTDEVLRGHTIFCDDIRAEIGGKTTFVGVYDGVMIVHGDFPFLLPKFGMAIRYMEQRGIFTAEPVTLRVFVPGDADDSPSFVAMLPAEEARKTVQMHPNADPNALRYLLIGSNIVLSPFVIARPGEIKVRAECGSEIVKLGSLLVVPGDSPAAPPA